MNLQTIYEPLTPLCPQLLLRKSDLWAWQGQQPALPASSAAGSSPCSQSLPTDIRWCSPPPHTGADWCGRWLDQPRSCRGQWGQCHFQTLCSILQIVKIYLSSDYLVVNDIWHFYHDLIVLLLLYIYIFFNNLGKRLWVCECNSCNTCLFSF